jgi:hypothetical protein
MMKKTVIINEEKNEVRYYEKDSKPEDYLDTIIKYLCASTDSSDKTECISDNDYMVLKSGKRIQHRGFLPLGS